MEDCSKRAGQLLPASQRRARAVYPSTGLLSLLAAVASSETVVDAKPLNFLCPLVDLPQEPHLNPRRYVADKYEKGDDGLWRQAESYTLYGSTMCKSCSQSNTQEPTPSPSVSSTVDFDFDSLPPGWKPQAHENRTSLILALSLVLAFFICFLIIGCLFWRKNIRRKSKSLDVEMTTGRNRQPDTERLIEQEIQTKKKLWAKAAARWKANVRHSARRRRGRRNTHRPQHQPEAETTSISIHPRDPSQTSIPSSSRHSIEVNTANTVPESDHEEIPFSPPLTPILASPPAYRQRSTGPTPSPADQLKPSSQSPLDLASSSSSFHPSASDELSRPSVHSAHVATDDKAVLEHLSSLANSPPSRDSSRLSDSLPQISSAPVWQDEELDDFDGPINTESSSESPQQSIWPSPPSKGKMAAHYDYNLEYSYSCYSFDEDISTLEPEGEPSAPPFDEPETCGPSAPPLEEVDTSAASAPDVSVLDVS